MEVLAGLIATLLVSLVAVPVYGQGDIYNNGPTNGAYPVKPVRQGGNAASGGCGSLPGLAFRRKEKNVQVTQHRQYKSMV